MRTINELFKAAVQPSENRAYLFHFAVQYHVSIPTDQLFKVY